MPNWCEGNIRFRGKKKDVVNLIMKEIEPLGKATIKVDEEMEEIYTTDTDSKWGEDFYIKGTHRCFIQEFHHYLCDCGTDEEIILCIDGFKSAWSIKDQGFKELAQKYQVDIKCVGFEQGGCFYQIVTFYKNGRKLEECKEYEPERYKWECLFPNLGG